jgi:hypothetical protein
MIFDDPIVFRSLLTKVRCICFTATPDDDDPKGAEKQVIRALKLTQFSYGFSDALTAPAKPDRMLAFSDPPATCEFI